MMTRCVLGGVAFWFVLLAANSHLAGQTTTLTINNASGSGDITDFVTTTGGVTSTKAQVDYLGDFITGTGGLYLFSNDTGISRDSTAGAGVFDFGTGSQGSKAGTLNASKFQLFGSSSQSISILPQATAGNYNFNLPTSAGSSGQPLLSGGGGSAPMTFGTLGLAAGGTNSANGAVTSLCAGASVSIPSSGTAFLGFGTSNTTGTEPLVYLPVPVSATVVSLHAQMGSLPPYQVTFHARYNGARFSADLTCQVNTTGNTWCDATGGTQTITEGSGNSWDIEAIAGSGTAASRNYAICLKATGAS